MTDAEKNYIVLEDQKYTGKSRVFVAGEKFAGVELLGSLEMALKGSPKHNVKPKIKVYVKPKETKDEAKK